MRIFDFFRRRSSETKGSSGPIDPFDRAFLARLEGLALASKRSARGERRGERRSKKRGSGVEFADHRPYAVGDDIRFLDVGAYERHEKLLVRLYEEEEDRSVYVVLDCSRSVGPENFRRARELAAALAYVALAGHDRVTVVGVTDHVVARLAPLRGKSRIFRVFGFLRGLEASGSTDLRRALVSFAAREKRRGIVLFLTDLYDAAGLEAGIDVLRFNRFEPVVLHLVPASTKNTELVGDLRLVDAETGEARDVTFDGVAEARFEERQREFEERARRYCVVRGVPYVRVRPDEPLEKIVLDALRRGGVLG